MRNGRMAAGSEKQPQWIACISLASVILLCGSGCVAEFHSVSFDVEPKPTSPVSATNFRVTDISHAKGSKKQLEGSLKAELEKLEKAQNPSLVEVPYSVRLNYLGHEETSDITRTLTGMLCFCSGFVLPHWVATNHNWEVSTILPGETVSFRGEQRHTIMASWFLLPVGLQQYANRPQPPPMAPPTAKAIFDSLTQARYENAIENMRHTAHQHLQDGKMLTDTDERLLEEDTSLETLVARAKHPHARKSGLSALSRIEDSEVLADIALHAAVPEIRKEAAQRATGLSEARFAQLAVESADDVVAETFLDRVSDDQLLRDVVQSSDASGQIKWAALEKIKQESVLADIAVHSSDADIRRGAIGGIDDPGMLLSFVLKDDAQKNRLAALARIEHPKALAVILRKSGDAKVRLEAVRKITDPAVLKEAVAKDADEAVRLAALDRVDDQDVFRMAAEADSSPAVRLAAVGKLTDPVLLIQVAKNSAHEENRLVALAKITDDAVVCDLAQTDPSAAVRGAAAAKTGNQQVLARIVRSDTASSVRLRAVQGLRDQDCLATVARQDDAPDVRAAAVAKIDVPVFLATIAKQDGDASVRRTALARVNDQSALAEIAKRDPDAKNRKQAVQRLDDETVLREIVSVETDTSVRRAALERVNDQGFLAEIARADPDAGTRKAAIQRLDDEALLREIALSEQESDVREAAIRKLPKDSQKMVRDALRRSAEGDTTRLIRQVLMATGSSKEDIQTVEALLMFQAALGGASLQEIQDAFPAWEDSGESDFDSWLESFGAGVIEGFRRGMRMKSWDSPDE